jgi:hypothetical protein
MYIDPAGVVLEPGTRRTDRRTPDRVTRTAPAGGRRPDYRDGMGLFSAWVLVTLTALAALGLAASAWRLTRRDTVPTPPGRAR